MDNKKYLWFPKLYSNKDWDNSISPDELLIKMMPKKTSTLKNVNSLDHHIKHHQNMGVIVFARVKGNLGYVLYRFKGYYVLNEKLSIENGYCCFERKSKKVLIPSGDPI